MNALIRQRRQGCCVSVILVILLQQVLVIPTSALQQVFENNIDNCSILCARENHVAATSSNAQESLPQQQQDNCICNVVTRILETQQERPKRRVEDDTSPSLVEAPDDDSSPTAVPTHGDDTFSPRPVPSTPTTSPRPVDISAPTDEGVEPPTVTTSTGSPHPSATPIIQPPQLPTISPKPTILKPPSSSEAPSLSPKPNDMMVPIQNPTTITPSLKPFTSTLAPMYAMETETPTKNDESNNDDYDGEQNYNEPMTDDTSPSSTEVITPSTTKSENGSSNSDLSGGSKFGIVLLVGMVIGVILVGYVTIQRRLRSSYRGSYSSTNGMMNHGAETELGLWESDSRRNHRDDDDGLL